MALPVAQPAPLGLGGSAAVVGHRPRAAAVGAGGIIVVDPLRDAVASLGLRACPRVILGGSGRLPLSLSLCAGGWQKAQ